MAFISKLPVRQITFACVRFYGLLFSKLPVWQITRALGTIDRGVNF